MAKQYDKVSRTREFTELNVMVRTETKSGKPALKMVKARVPFFVRRDNKRDYDTAITYLTETNLGSILGIDSVSKYLTINYTMPFSEFIKVATPNETENTKPKTQI